MRSETAVFPVPGKPVRKSEDRELITQPSVCNNESGSTRSLKAVRTVSKDAGFEGTAWRRIMSE